MTWSRPASKPAGSQLTQEEWKALPETLEVRLIKLSYEDRHGNKRDLVVVTTLLDHKKYDAHEVHALYHRRWDIEVKLRDIKETLAMDFVRVRSPEMAESSLLMVQIAYNLLRYLMQGAAAESGKGFDDLSLKSTLDLVTSVGESFRVLAGKPRRLRQRRGELLDLVATKALVRRPGRREPHATKRRPKSYPWLTENRHTYQAKDKRTARYREGAKAA